MENKKLYIYWLKKAAESGSMDAKVLLRGYEKSDLTKDVGLSDYICAIYASKSGKPFDYCDE